MNQPDHSDSTAGCEDEFYAGARRYWKSIPPTVDGMLGGYGQISSTDIGGSKKFLTKFIQERGGLLKLHRALDCGAGIGRITKRLLLPLFETVDMVELNQDFLDKAREFIGVESTRLDRLICSGLQEFTPEPGRYDVIWCQWVLGHLTDDDLVAFFLRCRAGLTERGVLVVKENMAKGSVDFDDKDQCFTRTRQSYVNLVQQAKLQVMREERQMQFPEDLYEVRMFAIQ